MTDQPLKRLFWITGAVFAVMGDERPLADFIQSKYILLFGWNPTSAIKWIYLPRILTRGIERGARLVVVDPYLSDTAAKAHEWVRIRPATDGAMALAMANVIIREGLYDREFVRRWTVGFDEYAAYLADKTPAWAELVTTVPAKTIERLAREVATTKPALVDVWSGPGHHFLSGSIPPGRSTVPTSALRRAMARPPRKLETVVVIDTMLSETAILADYVLPGTVFLERYDLNSHWVTWPVLGLRQPVVKPLFGQPAEYEVVAALGRRLGLKDKSGKDHFRIGQLSGKPIDDLTAWYEDHLSAELKNGAPGMTLPELKALPGAVWVDRQGTRYEKYTDPIPADKLTDAFYDGEPRAEGTVVYDKPKDKGGARTGVVVGGAVVKGFATPSRKIEFVSNWLAEKPDADGKSVSPLPAYAPRDWLPSAGYPLYLVNWKEVSHTQSRTQNNPWLLEIKPENPLVVHPDTAARYGVADGDAVVIESPYGAVRAKVRVSRRIHPEVVGLMHGFGHRALGKLARGRGTSDSPLRPTRSDPLSGQALHKETCVRIARA